MVACEDEALVKVLSHGGDIQALYQRDFPLPVDKQKLYLNIRWRRSRRQVLSCYSQLYIGNE